MEDDDDRDCPTCEGTGYYPDFTHRDERGDPTEGEVCTECNGSGIEPWDRS